jgi:imidazolonepropionase-like amidohydrolase
MTLLTLAVIGAAQTPETVALTHANIIDGTGAPSQLDQTILIQGGKINAVYPSASRPPPNGAKTEDLTGKWVIPGMIDAHVHITEGSGEIGPLRDLLSKLLLRGVTGVRDMAGDARILGYLAREARLDAPGWADVYYSALMAGPTFFFEDARVPAASRGVLVGSAPWLRAVDETTDIHLAVAEAKGTGATGIKLYANLPASRVKAIAAEAHRQGMLVWAHASVFPAKPADIIDAGTDVVSHTAYLVWQAEAHVPPDYRQRGQADFSAVRPEDPKITALIADMKERGTILDATLRVFQQQAARSADSVAKGLMSWIYAVTRATHQAGVLIDAGTDSQGLTSGRGEAGAAVVEEMMLLVKECGFTPLEAIHSATQVGAMAVGRASERGTIARNMSADLVILSGDPTADIANVKKVVAVFKDGKEFQAAESK